MCQPNGTHFSHVGPSLRDGYRDFIAFIASLGETRPRDITQSECHWALAAGFPAHLAIASNQFGEESLLGT